MALSAQTYQGDGSNTDFVLDFTLGYISESHIHVYVDDVEIPQNTLQFILGGGSVRLPTAPASGSEVLVRRIVPNDKLLHDYENGSLVIESNLDESNLQSIMLQHEAVDGFSTGIYGDINFFTEISDSPKDTAESPRGVEQITITGLASLAEEQRDGFETTFNAQFIYKRIGNLSDYSGMSLTEADKLNSYQYPDDSGNWYAPLQGQPFPYMLPSDPTVANSGMVLTSTVGTYRGLWLDTGGSANKGDTYQTQVSGTGTGQYFTALQNTTADPVGDDVNWRAILGADLGGVISGTKLQHRRGTATEILAGVPTISELWFNTTDNSIHMGDGVTVGGIKQSNPLATSVNSNYIVSSIDNTSDLIALSDSDITFRKGVYVVSGDVTLTGRLTFESGAFLQSTAGNQIIYGTIVSDDYPFLESGGTISIGKVLLNSSDFTSIQDMINSTPTKAWQRFEMTIEAGTYDEDVLVDSKFCMASVNTGGERAGHYIFGNVSNKFDVQIKSVMFVNGGGGSFTPAISHVTMYGIGPRTNEACPIEFYGVQGGAAHNIAFRDTTGSAARCVMSYGSNVSCESNDFGTGLYDYAYTTKHGGTLYDNSNNALGVGASSFGTLKNKISQSISGHIGIGDSSGMRYPQAQPHNVYGVGNGMVYDQGRGALFGPMVLMDSISAYQSYFTNLSDFSQYVAGSGSVVIDGNNGMLVDTGATGSSTANAYIRRLNTCSNHAIHTSQTLKAAIQINALSGTSSTFEIGIGSGSGQPRVFIRVDEFNVRLVTYNGATEITSGVICTTADILGQQIIIDIDIQSNAATNVYPSQLGFARASITKRNFTVYTSEQVDIVTGADTTYQWNVVASNPSGQVTAYVSEIRLFRYPIFNASA